MEKTQYSVLIGLWKSVKNNLIIFIPAFLAFLASCPPKYTPIASVIAYMIKNYIEFNKK